MLEMIDISEHNVRRGTINWNKVRTAGISGVMIRIGWAGYEGGIAANKAVDQSLDTSIKGAHAAGLDVGLYVYTYTKTPAAARIAAAECVKIAKRYPGIINLPIAFDVEETVLPCLTEQGKAGLTNTVIAFLEECERMGYYAVWYTYTAFAIQYLDRARLAAYDLWIADYRGNERLMQSQIGRRNYGMWQYLGDKGTCTGVTGPCDRNYCYVDYPATIAAAGLNGLTVANGPNYRRLYEAKKAECERLQSELAKAQQKADKFDQMMAIAQA
ncbi:GH25 family lysozyme [Oscillospiraceae bacterium LTW-04]|nr:GH25 family lysozyme [Oscillospiraceae bacterium MB24-C1]